MSSDVHQPLVVLDVSHEHASTLVRSAIEKSEMMSVPVVICVMSVRGNIKQLISMDGAPIRSVDIARLKAKTSMLFGRATRDLQQRVQPGQPLHTIEHSNDGLTVVAGGYPITFENHIIGGLGISGGTPDQDCEIAAHALGILSIDRPKPN